MWGNQRVKCVPFYKVCITVSTLLCMADRGENYAQQSLGSGE
ncbi:unnamed protein product [Staurois parvus]|uniref:Uncharacterized protein n=1 Tax=Staurois parvus TaxID=386267 RepID=A0ABN9FVF6_9NEOB|nr:unnamed protein product [Staurois parvus]